MTNTYAITVTIDGIDRTSLVMAESIYIRKTKGNVADVASFRLRDTTVAGFAPVGWDEVTIQVDGVRVFGGFIVRKESYPIGTTYPYARRTWEIECQSWVILLDGVTVDERYHHQSDPDILADLFATYLGSDGFDIALNVDTINSDIGKMYFNRISLREALDKLADYVQADWYIDENKTLWWNSRVNAPVAPFNINTVDTVGIAPLDGTMRRILDESSIVNEVTVIRMRVRSETWAYDAFNGTGTATEFGPVTKEPVSFDYVEWIRAGGANATANIGYDPGDRLTTEGGEYLVVANLDTWTFRIAVAPDSGTLVHVQYHYYVPYTLTYTDSDSVTYYGRTIGRTFIDNSTYSFDEEVDAFAAQYLDTYANGKETIEFDVTTHGLNPGQVLSVFAPTADVTVLAEGTDPDPDINADQLRLGVATDNVELRSYVIQSVTIHPVPSGGSGGKDVVIASIIAGAHQSDLIQALQTLSDGRSLTAGGNNVATFAAVGASNNSSNLGNVSSGRLAFITTPGTSFTWSNYGSATGVVIGLDDSSGTATGNMMMLQGGTVRAQVGLVTGRANIGTVVPTGWGIWTNNGYFSGQVAASTISGGTITGGLISGGTVTGSLISGGTVTGSYITGGTITANTFTGATFIGGTIATSTPPINSGNPGVIIDSAGLRGYGTIGLAFNIPSDGAAPTFSSGTITNVVYEIGTASVIRTNSNPAANGGIQIDDSGIFAYNTVPTQTFSLDATGGVLTGGTVTGSLVTGGTVSAAGGTVTLTSDGITFNPVTMPTSYQTQMALEYQEAGSVVGYLSMFSPGGTENRMTLVADNNNGDPGRMYFIANGVGAGPHPLIDMNSLTSDNYISIIPDALAVNRGTVNIQAHQTIVRGTIIPLTTNAYPLGDSTHAFTKLLLHDGTDEWEVTVNTSGTLITTKV